MKIFSKLILLNLLLIIPNLLLGQTCDNDPCKTGPITSQPFKEICAGKYKATPIRTYIRPRSQGANTARELVGWQWELNRPYMCQNYGSLYVAYEYQQTYDPSQITDMLFGGPTLNFAGSQVANRNPKTDLLADYWALAQDFEGSATFKPYTRSQIVDIGFYMGLDSWMQGLYARFHFPITHTEWSLNGIECSAPSSKTFPLCYVSGVQTVIPGSDFNTVGTVSTFQTLQEALGSTNIPFNKICFCPLTKTGLADIDFIIGYNFFNSNCFHFGLYIQNVLPTAEKLNNERLFNPVVGNNGHYELGIGVSSHAVLWGTENKNLAVFLEGNVTHLFKNFQARSFDLCKNGPFSRYMSAKLYDENKSISQLSTDQFNLSTITNTPVSVSVDIKYDISMKLAFRWNNFGYDLGYNLYGHSREKLKLLTPSSFTGLQELSKLAAPKGTEGVCCSNYPVIITENGDYKIFPDGTPGLVGAQTLPDCPEITEQYTVTVSTNLASQPNATAYSGADNFGIPLPQNCDISLAYNSPPVTDPNGVPENAKTIEEFNQKLAESDLIACNNSFPGEFLNIDDLNLRSAQSPAVMTHKIFVHFNYTWYENSWSPHIGIGGEGEFSGTKAEPDGKSFASLGHFGIWLKTGVSF